MSKNNPFAKADSKEAQDPNSMGGTYVQSGKHTFEVLDVKLVDNDREGKMFHVWELRTLETDNDKQEKLCAFLCRVQPDPYLYGIKDAKAIAAAALGVPFESVDSALLSASTTEEGKKAFVGAKVSCEGANVTTKQDRTIVKTKWAHVSAAPESAA